MSKLVGAIGFVAGFAIGFGTSCIILKKKYETKLNQGLQDIRNAYTEPKEEKIEDNDKTEVETITEKPVQTKVTNIATLLEPNDVELDENGEWQLKNTSREVNENEPYEISYDEFSEKEGYDTRSLIYYIKSNVVTEYLAGEDPDEIKVDKPAELIGVDTLCSFENCEDDTIYVRNDKLKSDFEVVVSAKTYKKPATKKASPEKEG